jgi:hypothetical protein
VDAVQRRETELQAMEAAEALRGSEAAMMMHEDPSQVVTARLLGPSMQSLGWAQGLREALERARKDLPPFPPGPPARVERRSFESFGGDTEAVMAHMGRLREALAELACALRGWMGRQWQMNEGLYAQLGVAVNKLGQRWVPMV